VIQNMDTHMPLYRARLFLEEGQYEAALKELEAVRPVDEKQRRDLDYFLGWCYVQLKQWDEALRVLSPLITQISEHSEQETLLERDRLALHLLNLGVAAVNLSHYEDASQHFALCLKVLHDRRVHLPAVRIKARYYLGMTCIMRGLYTTAVRHYEEALRLCHHYRDEEELAHIYHGLCEVYRDMGDFARADSVGHEALRLYQQRGDRPMEARMHHLLAHNYFLSGDYRAAEEHYTTSLTLSLSEDRAKLVMLNYAALADVCLAEGRLQDADYYCQLALEYMQRTSDAHMRSRTYQVIARVSHAAARRAEDEERRRQLLEETMAWLEQAKSELAQTQAYPDIAEVYESMAVALEDLGRVEEAIACWRSGYEVLSHTVELSDVPPQSRGFYTVARADSAQTNVPDMHMKCLYGLKAIQV
jgi:tetratricopeptide (TPR) repeat protein